MTWFYALLQLILSQVKGSWGAITQWLVTRVFFQMFNIFSDAYADYKKKVEQKNIADAVEELKRARTKKEQEDATKKLADNSF